MPYEDLNFTAINRRLDQAAMKREREAKRVRIAELVGRVWRKWLDARSCARIHLWHYRKRGNRSRLRRANEAHARADRAWRWYEKLTG